MSDHTQAVHNLPVLRREDCLVIQAVAYALEGTLLKIYFTALMIVRSIENN